MTENTVRARFWRMTAWPDLTLAKPKPLSYRSLSFAYAIISQVFV